MLKRFLEDDSLSIALFSLFLLCVTGQSVAGWSAYDSALTAAHRPAIGWAAYLATGDFLDGVFSNWQAAILQLAVLIAFSSVLRQRGAAHSRKPAGEGEAGEAPNPRTLQLNFRSHDSAGGWLHAHSLSLVFFVAFAACFAAHIVFGQMSYNEEQALRGQPALGLGAYVSSADFLKSLMQTWEAEFFAIGFYVVASIVLRQEGSPESKPADAPDGQTGETDG